MRAHTLLFAFDLPFFAFRFPTLVHSELSSVWGNSEGSMARGLLGFIFGESDCLRFINDDERRLMIVWYLAKYFHQCNLKNFVLRLFQPIFGLCVTRVQLTSMKLRN